MMLPDDYILLKDVTAALVISFKNMMNQHYSILNGKKLHLISLWF